MTAGIQIFGDNSLIQIDSDYENLAIVRKVTKTANTLGNTPYGWRFDVEDIRTDLSDFTLVGMRCANAAVGLYRQNWVAGGGIRTMIDGYAPSAGTYSVDIYYFDVPDVAPSASGALFEVYTETSALAFSNDVPYMNPEVFINSSWTPPYPVDVGVHRTINHGLTPGNFCFVPVKRFLNERWEGEVEMNGIIFPIVGYWYTRCSFTAGNAKIEWTKHSHDDLIFSGDVISNDYSYMLVKLPPGW